MKDCNLFIQTILLPLITTIAYPVVPIICVVETEVTISCFTLRLKTGFDPTERCRFKFNGLPRFAIDSFYVVKERQFSDGVTVIHVDTK
ncbi:CLUMA_CG011776, isoform A [Clunio marinus]|uniref:CLUMA_CG011776, isoform A n=1 Tax=Clunio marinus TaxID=568069 RepID=A0A1J1IF83_9DIPT|nr:CLUMA_CG011776, isoform A [Clunio marinus]